MIINVTATGYITLSSPNRNTDFLENPLVAFDIIGVFTMLDNPNCNGAPDDYWQMNRLMVLL
ncbi:MAG: hypothetical protein IJO60_05545, partial [Agathobacter sp.]|nr:hypothetical protein [Agathobacter sp.]